MPELKAKTPASAVRPINNSRRVHLPVATLRAFLLDQSSLTTTSKALVTAYSVKSIVFPASGVFVPARNSLLPPGTSEADSDGWTQEEVALPSTFTFVLSGRMCNNLMPIHAENQAAENLASILLCRGANTHPACFKGLDNRMRSRSISGGMSVEPPTRVPQNAGNLLSERAPNKT